MGIAFGVIAFLWPGLTALALLYLIAGWAIVRGVFEIIAAVHLQREIDNEWLLALSGVLSVLLAVILAMAPEAGALELRWWIGSFAIVVGALTTFLGIRLRGIGGQLARQRA